MAGIMNESEQSIQHAILEYLNLYGVAVKTGNGAFKIGQGVNERFVKLTTGYNGGRGWPDIVWAYHGVVYLIEVKKPGGKLSENQKIMHAALKEQGITVHVMKSLDDSVALKEGRDNS